jgi:aminopeptidase
LAVIADVNTKALTSVDPARQTMARAANGELMQRFLERDAAGELRWCVTAYPAQGNAQDAEMSLAEYADFVYGAALVHEDDPVEAWRDVARRQEAVKRLLEAHKSIHVVGPGTDLRFSTAGRTWINDRGDKNLPGGEVFTGPVEDSVEGHITFHFPALVDGREVDGVSLTFKQGKVVEASAKKGGELIQSVIDTDEGARFAGEFAFGLNRHITRGTKEVLYDEKIGGTCHLALGASYPESGGRNKSALHQDFVCDLRHESAVYADEEQVFADGVFLESALKELAAS